MLYHRIIIGSNLVVKMDQMDHAAGDVKLLFLVHSVGILRSSTKLFTLDEEDKWN